jgi:hypothetical protein
MKATGTKMMRNVDSKTPGATNKRSLTDDKSNRLLLVDGSHPIQPTN